MGFFFQINGQGSFSFTTLLLKSQGHKNKWSVYMCICHKVYVLLIAFTITYVNLINVHLGNHVINFYFIAMDPSKGVIWHLEIFWGYISLNYKYINIKKVTQWRQICSRQDKMICVRGLKFMVLSISSVLFKWSFFKKGFFFSESNRISFL